MFIIQRSWQAGPFTDYVGTSDKLIQALEHLAVIRQYASNKVERYRLIEREINDRIIED